MSRFNNSWTRNHDKTTIMSGYIINISWLSSMLTYLWNRDGTIIMNGSIISILWVDLVTAEQETTTDFHNERVYHEYIFIGLNANSSTELRRNDYHEWIQHKYIMSRLNDRWIRNHDRSTIMSGFIMSISSLGSMLTYLWNYDRTATISG